MKINYHENNFYEKFHAHNSTNLSLQKIVVHSITVVQIILKDNCGRAITNRLGSLYLQLLSRVSNVKIKYE